MNLPPERKSKRKKETRKEIPKKFFKQIQKLGLRKEDAEILFETKVDWTAVYSNNKIYCTEVGHPSCGTDNCDICQNILPRILLFYFVLG